MSRLFSLIGIWCITVTLIIHQAFQGGFIQNLKDTFRGSALRGDMKVASVVNLNHKVGKVQLARVPALFKVRACFFI